MEYNYLIPCRPSIPIARFLYRQHTNAKGPIVLMETPSSSRNNVMTTPCASFGWYSFPSPFREIFSKPRRAKVLSRFRDNDNVDKKYFSGGIDFPLDRTNFDSEQTAQNKSTVIL